MALDYTRFFTRVGKLVKKLNAYKATGVTTYPADLKEIADQFEADDVTDQIAGLYGVYAGFSDGVTGIRAALASFADLSVTDRVTVLAQIGLLTDASLDQVLVRLYRQMVADSQTVEANTVTLGTVTAGGGNVGNGTFFTTLVMDGSSRPALDATANPLYHGVTSELGVHAETMLLECTADGDDGLADGESFTWQGGENFGRLDWRGEGSGRGPGLNVLNQSSFVSNGEMETWSVANVPDSWTLGAGTTAGTHVFQQTPAGANVYRGASSLKLIGDSVAATVELSQALTGLQSLTTYALAVNVKCSGAGTAGDDVVVKVEGTGYTPGALEKVTLSGGALPTSWTTYGRFWRTPALVPSDLAVKVQLTGTPTNTTTVYVDAVVIGPVLYHGGVGCFGVAGTAQFVVGDRFSFTVANSDGGVWSKFFREWWRVQLPSVGGAAETIADSLAS